MPCNSQVLPSPYLRSTHTLPILLEYVCGVLLLMSVVDHLLRVVVELLYVGHLKDLARGVALQDGWHDAVYDIDRFIGHCTMLDHKMIQHGTYLYATRLEVSS